MKNLITFLCGILLILSGSTEAGKIDKPYVDKAPNVGPVNHNPPTDDMWDLLAYYNINSQTGDYQIFGVQCFIDDPEWPRFYATGGNNDSQPNKLYELDSTGTYVGEYDQPGTDAWGWRDLCTDRTYLYGSGCDTIYAMDFNGNPAPEMYIVGPFNLNRALAYDPTLDHFWVANYTGTIYEIDRDGVAVGGGGDGGDGGITGMAWDEYALDGPWLWLFCQSGYPPTTIVQFDPINKELTRLSYQVPLLPGLTSQSSRGGALNSMDWGPTPTLLTIHVSGEPHGLLVELELYPGLPGGAPGPPEDLIVTTSGASMTVDLSWTNPDSTLSGDPLTNIDLVYVMVDGVTDTVLTGTNPGQFISAMPVPIPGPPSPHKFTVYCTYDSITGAHDYWSTWVGLDVPNNVDNLEAEFDSTQGVVLTWVNPAMGGHGGYFPPGSIEGYIITRDNGVNPDTIFDYGISTSYLDALPMEEGFYQYSVIPFNSSGFISAMPINIPLPLEPVWVSEAGNPPWLVEEQYEWKEANPANPDPPYLECYDTGIIYDDQVVGPIDIGFEVEFFGETYSEIYISSNGWASFDPQTSSYYSNQPIPSSSGPNNLIAPYWDDLNPSEFGNVYYAYNPFDSTFIVQWDSCAHYGSTVEEEYFTFEMELGLMRDYDIRFNYKAIFPGTTNPFPSATGGLEDYGGNFGYQMTYDGSGLFEPTTGTSFRVYTPPIINPDFTVTLTYNYGSPVPAGGGYLNFDVSLTNNESTPQPMDLWIEIPPAIVPPIVPNRSFTFAAGFTINRPDMNWPVPASWAPGNYDMVWNIGELATTTVWAQDSFPFSKSADDDGSGFTLWEVEGDPLDQLFDDIGMGTSSVVSEFALHQAYPNPFNPNTAISYQLSTLSRVNLSVYDIAGKKVAELVNGWREAGYHEVTFDGSGLASGMYFYQVQAGNFNAVRKMVLIK